MYKKGNKIVMLTQNLIYFSNYSLLFQQTCQYHRNVYVHFPLVIAVDVYCRMEHSSVQVDTVLPHTFAVMATETAET
jgi:hypothetical protein